MDTATAAQTLLQWVWPRTCAHCREDLPREAGSPLCLACRLRLVPAEPPYCRRCAQPARDALCRRCQGPPEALSLLRPVFLYREAAVSLVHAFKYRGSRAAARAAGGWMGTALSRFPELGRPDALVPMPLHPLRRRERGYNQALLLAEGLSARAGIAVRELALRRRDTRPQWALAARDRRRNVRGAFEARPEAAGLRLLLVDDVCTTGASLEECAEALKDAGAAWVGALVLARQSGPMIT